MTLIGEKLAEKLSEKKQDINSFIWKGPKINGEQQEYKLVDADLKQLQKWYNHCAEMLYNDDSKNPGRITLLNIVMDQIQRCRAELLIRWLKSEKKYTPYACLEDLRVLISNNKEVLTQEAIKTFPIGDLISGIPLEYNRVPVSLVMDACLDTLGTFKNDHLTINFIIKMGLWFTGKEMQKSPEEGGVYVKNPTTGKAMNRLEVVSKTLNLDPKIRLRISDTGLSYSEFEAIYKLKRNKYPTTPEYSNISKYSNLTTLQLQLLSSKVLYRFQQQCDEQAKQWLDKIDEIEKVAQSKGWELEKFI